MSEKATNEKYIKSFIKTNVIDDESRLESLGRFATSLYLRVNSDEGVTNNLAHLGILLKQALNAESDSGFNENDNSWTKQFNFTEEERNELPDPIMPEPGV